jgi:hypothetical protein
MLIASGRKLLSIPHTSAPRLHRPQQRRRVSAILAPVYAAVRDTFQFRWVWSPCLAGPLGGFDGPESVTLPEENAMIRSSSGSIGQHRVPGDDGGAVGRHRRGAQRVVQHGAAEPRCCLVHEM